MKTKYLHTMARIKKNSTTTPTQNVENSTNTNENNSQITQITITHEIDTNVVIDTPCNQEEKPTVKKRGRKPKQKENIECEEKEKEGVLSTTGVQKNIQIVKSPNIETQSQQSQQSQLNVSNNVENEENDDNNNTEEKEKVIKKRGRKPKGGKIIQQSTSINNIVEAKPNVILHLKCSIKELQSNLFGTNIESFNFGSKANIVSNCETLGSTQLECLDTMTNTNNAIYNVSNTHATTSCVNINGQNIEQNEQYTNSHTHDVECCETKDIWKKLKQLEHNLHMNNISDKRSACFWCTYDFDNPPVYIPKHHIKDSYHVYGCFCSPECGAAYLMEENIDSSSKFERYYLLNHIYSKIYNYTKEIKPSPNPYYMLEKYYGNLTIQEYRSLLRNERLFLIVDKPLTRILPELHEDNDDFIINNKIIPSNTYQVKKNFQKKTSSKSEIIHEKFGFA
jgi:hypothetical protein